MDQLQNYYDLVQRHLSEGDTSAIIEQIRSTCSLNQTPVARRLSISQLEIYFQAQDLEYQFDKINLKKQDLKDGDLNLILQKVLAYVLYRIYYYDKKNQFNIQEITSNFLKCLSDIVIIDQHRVDKQNYLVHLSFLNNYSRCLVDQKAEYLGELRNNMIRLINILAGGCNNRLIRIEYFQDKGQAADYFRDGVLCFRESIKSSWAREGLLSYMKSVELNNSYENSIFQLEQMPIYLIKEKFGINGMVGFGYVILSLDQLTKSLNENKIMARVFVCLWHEASHYLLRNLRNDYLTSTPEGDEDGKYGNLEVGYRLERFLFGTYEFRIWEDQDFQQIINNQDWLMLQSYRNTDFNLKKGLEPRESYLEASRMEIAITPSWKE